MTDKSQDQKTTLCPWCSKLILPAAKFADGVCLNCYRLLYNAGITDKEIFADFGGRTGNLSDAARLQ